ncbi:MAG: hypothetical protein KDD29_05280 [Flavobacteriales bacterium]|nr:hypothetical protein [Flavobacteriales bacterium]
MFNIKRNIYISLLLVFCNQLSAQNDDLSGNIYILSCFISDGVDQWTSNEKNNMLTQTNEALQWITKQGKSYGKDINFEHGCFGIEYDIVIDHIERGKATGKEDFTMIERTLRKIGFKDQNDLTKWVKTNTKNKDVKVLVFVKGTGNAYCIACPYYYPMECPFVEGAIIYEKYWSNRPLATTTIAHELLHTFGAWDLYHTFEQTQEQENKARILFPNSIMLKIEYNIDKSNVDELTAWLIGWNKIAKDWYWWFKPK